MSSEVEAARPLQTQNKISVQTEIILHSIVTLVGGLALLEAQVFPVEFCSGASACLSNLRSQLLVQDKYLNDYSIFNTV